jgi:putative phosphoribosyl transferase
MIVGGNDHVILEVNREALREMTCPRRLEIVPDAGHLFEEPGALDTVADLTIGWFSRYLTWVEMEHRQAV